MALKVNNNQLFDAFTFSIVRNFSIKPGKTNLLQFEFQLTIDLQTRFHACKRVTESHWKISKACSFYHVKRSSLFRRLKKFDGTVDSLIDKSHKPLSPHPKTLSEETVRKVLNYRRRKPDYSYMEIWLRMKRKNYQISLSSVLRILKRAKEYTPYVSNAKKKYDQKYHTPRMIGENGKWM